jgi:polyferredoxin
MGKLGHESLIEWGSLAQMAAPSVPGAPKRRRVRSRTLIYASLLTGIAAAGAVLLVARAPFDAEVQRAPGSLFVMDNDGYVRNTYLLRVTNKAAGAPTAFHIRVEGLAQENVIVQDVSLGTTESRTFPLIIRMKASPDLPRTIPIEVHVSTPGHEVELEATFKTEGHLGTE